MIMQDACARELITIESCNKFAQTRGVMHITHWLTRRYYILSIMTPMLPCTTLMPQSHQIVCACGRQQFILVCDNDLEQVLAQHPAEW